MAIVAKLVTYGMLACEPFIEWGLFPVNEFERFLCELANQENGVLSTPPQDLIECCPVASFHSILKSHFSLGLVTDTIIHLPAESHREELLEGLNLMPLEFGSVASSYICPPDYSTWSWLRTSC